MIPWKLRIPRTRYRSARLRSETYLWMIMSSSHRPMLEVSNNLNCHVLLVEIPATSFKDLRGIQEKPPIKSLWITDWKNEIRWQGMYLLIGCSDASNDWGLVVFYALRTVLDKIFPEYELGWWFSKYLDHMLTHGSNQVGARQPAIACLDIAADLRQVMEPPVSRVVANCLDQHKKISCSFWTKARYKWKNKRSCGLRRVRCRWK